MIIIINYCRVFHALTESKSAGALILLINLYCIIRQHQELVKNEFWGIGKFLWNKPGTDMTMLCSDCGFLRHFSVKIYITQFLYQYFLYIHTHGLTRTRVPIFFCLAKNNIRSATKQTFIQQCVTIQQDGFFYHHYHVFH